MTGKRETCQFAQQDIHKACHSARSEAQSQNPPPSQRRMPKPAYVYILASRRQGTLYTGVTSNLIQRVHQHRTHLLDGFTQRYEVALLVWFTQGEDISAAITLEKKIKNRGRKWKIALIEKTNPDWKDLGADWMSAGAGNDAEAACKIATPSAANGAHA
jgi:putative endonuclease